MKFAVETSALADAVRKASVVAPSKGHAFDAAAGIVIQVDPSNVTRPIAVKATDLETTFHSVLPAESVSGDPVAWRFPSGVLAGFLGQLPMGAGQSVTLEADPEDRTVVHVRAGRTKARLRTIAGDSFPRFGRFDPDGMRRVDHFAQRVQQVAWTVDREEGVLAGIHIDGDWLTACNRVTTARVPCTVPVDEPITVPLAALAGVMKNTSEVSMRATDRRLHIMTDEDTQGSTLIYEQDYPNVDAIFKVVEGFERRATISVEGLTQVLQRQMVLCKAERYPSVSLTFSHGALRIAMDVPDLGQIDDEIDVEGADHDAFELHFTPTIFIAALGVTKMAKFDLTYGEPLKPVLIDDGNGYRVVAMPRRA